MSHVTCQMTISVDGFVAGPHQRREDPIGVGGGRLHRWIFQADEPGHEADARMRDQLMQGHGAYIMGRNMFGPTAATGGRGLARLLG